MATLPKVEAEKILSKSGWLTRVPSQFRSEILRQSIMTQYKPGEAIFRVGDAPGGIFGLVDGTVSISVAPTNRVPRLIMLGVPGYWTGEGCFLTGAPRRGEVRAVLETTMLRTPLDVLDRMNARDPMTLRYISQILMMSVEFLLEIINDLQKPEADRRIASVLRRATLIGHKPIPLTQTELGVMANTSRKQVNAALKRFAEKGWLSIAYRSITILNVTAIRRFAEGEGRT